MPEVSISLLKILVISNHNRVFFRRPDNSDLQTEFQCFVNDVLLFSISIFFNQQVVYQYKQLMINGICSFYAWPDLYVIFVLCVYTCIYSTLSQNTRTSSQMRHERLKCTGIVFVFGSWFYSVLFLCRKYQQFAFLKYI